MSLSKLTEFWNRLCYQNVNVREMFGRSADGGQYRRAALPVALVAGVLAKQVWPGLTGESGGSPFWGKKARSLPRNGKPAVRSPYASLKKGRACKQAFGARNRAVPALGTGRSALLDRRGLSLSRMLASQARGHRRPFCYNAPKETHLVGQGNPLVGQGNPLVGWGVAGQRPAEGGAVRIAEGALAKQAFDRSKSGGRGEASPLMFINQGLSLPRMLACKHGDTAAHSH